MLLDAEVRVNESRTACVHCPECGSRDLLCRGECRLPGYLEALPDAERELLTSVPASLYSCRECGFGFRSPALAAESLQSLYASMPKERWQYATQNTAWKMANDWLQQHVQLGESKQLLDVGAFDGAFLKSVPQGWDRHAIEPSVEAQTELRRNGITVVANMLDEPLPENRGRFDVVTMFDVFEHLPTAKKSLSHAIAYLRAGGHLLLSTGNCEHWSWKLLGGDQWYCSTVQHLSFASTRYMESAARACGARMQIARKHPHQTASWRQQLSQAYETCAYAAFRRPVWWGPVLKCISLIPALSYVRHKTMGPYTPALNDHLFFVIEKLR